LRLSVIASNHLSAKGIAVDLAASFPSLFQQFCLSLIFQSPFAERSLQPCIEPTVVNGERVAHAADVELLVMPYTAAAAYLPRAS
jgi:hypothetical protein